MVATSRRVYCVHEDLNRGFTWLQWSMGKENLVANGCLVVAIGTRDKTDRTGLLDIGAHRGWLFTKKLFANGTAGQHVPD